jgi:hypothetical protein
VTSPVVKCRFVIRLTFLILAALLTGCARDRWFSVPEQRGILEPVKLDAPGHFVTMNHPNAKAYFVRDIGDELLGNLWRWTGKRPALRFHLPESQGLSFMADLVIPDAMFKITGPVQIAFSINDHPFETVRYEEQGEKHVEKRVPPEWLLPGRDNIVTAEIDKVLPGGRGFVLVRAGFIQ